MSGAPTPSIRSLDPLVEVQKLRDHLASHDKPIAFLFGAGTSAGVLGTDGQPLVPAVAELTRRCQSAVEALGGPYANAWKQIVAGLPADRRTIEDILSAVRTMRTVLSGTDKLAGLDEDQLSRLESELQMTISREARPPDGRFPDRLPHTALGRWLRRIERSLPIEIFTTNYDTLIERALEAEWAPVFDGFVRGPSAILLGDEPGARGDGARAALDSALETPWVCHVDIDGRLERRSDSPRIRAGFRRVDPALSAQVRRVA